MIGDLIALVKDGYEVHLRSDIPGTLNLHLTKVDGMTRRGISVVERFDLPQEAWQHQLSRARRLIEETT